MKRLHRIGNSKAPLPGQMLKMTQNLHTVFPNAYIAIEEHCLTYGDGRYKTEFWFNIEGRKGDYIQTWKEVLDHYRQLMKEASND